MNFLLSALTSTYGRHSATCCFSFYIYSSSFVPFFLRQSCSSGFWCATFGVCFCAGPLLSSNWSGSATMWEIGSQRLCWVSLPWQQRRWRRAESFCISRIWPELENILFSGPKAAFVCGAWKQMLRNICFCQNTCSRFGALPKLKHELELWLITEGISSPAALSANCHQFVKLEEVQKTRIGSCLLICSFSPGTYPTGATCWDKRVVSDDGGHDGAMRKELCRGHQWSDSVSLSESQTTA